MNQMMGASSTALAELLGEPVNISTPNSFEINTVAEFSEKYLLENEPMVVVSFSLKVEDALESEFLNVMTVDLARKMLSCFGLGMGDETEGSETVEETAEPKAEAQAMPYERFLEPLEPDDGSSGRMMNQEEIEKLLSQSFGDVTSANESADPPAIEVKQNNPAPPQVESKPVEVEASEKPSFTPPKNNVSTQPKVIDVIPNAELQNQGGGNVCQERAENLDLIMGVPLEISVEIGRTKKNVREILEYNTGSLIVLDKLAGEQVDIYVNGQCIAKGDVVVVDDNFGVRVTEVLRKI